MKTKLHKVMVTAVLGWALVSQSIPAWAGLAGLTEVNIAPLDSISVAAAGSMVGARYSAGNKQFIGCSAHTREVYYPYMTCMARDRTGRVALCMSSDPRFLDAVKAITDSSLIYFAFWGGVCDEVNITNESRYLR